MPTITHAMAGGLIALLLYTYSQFQLKTSNGENSTNSPNKDKKRFNKEHVILFSLNSFVGPDFPKFFYPFMGPNFRDSQVYIVLHNNFSHTLLGWVVWSIVFALIYYSIFRYATKARETKEIPISLLHCYLVILGAGIFHFALDILDEGTWIFPEVFGKDTYLTLEDFYTGYSLAEGPLATSFSWLGAGHLLILGVIFLVILIWMLYHSSIKQIWLMGGFFFLLIYGLIYLVGSNLVYNENDLGILLYVAFFWVFPVVLCFISMEKVKSGE